MSALSKWGKLLICLATFLPVSVALGQLTEQSKTYTRADSLRGSLNPERTWWDVLHYDISVRPEFAEKTITGSVSIRFRANDPGTVMQIDLQKPMNITSAKINGTVLSFEREHNAYHLTLPAVLAKGTTATLQLEFSGRVTEAKNPPWDGGWIFSKDQKGRPWMTVACQGLGASVWYPCKDHQSDEPDEGASLTVTVPDTLMAVGNGRLKENKQTAGGTSYTWEVSNPINNYNIVPYIGKYVSFGENYTGELGELDCQYWVLDYNLEKARKQFTQVKTMLKAFEYWFGPYPFYGDGFKLVESPHLGMEHQSAIAYGNGYRNGYRGRDLSGTGHGLDWDFIIVHESGHEWFGNNITSKDIADMWVHEGFTNYAETLFTDFLSGKTAGDAYVQGTRKLILNRSPIIGNYGVNEEGSGDMYYKGGNLVHYIRQLFKDDEAFRMALREMNKTFRHKTVTTAEIEKFWTAKAGISLTSLFNQYLRDTRIPVLEVKTEQTKVIFRWTECRSDFNAPVAVFINGKRTFVQPGTAWQTLKYGKKIKSVEPDKNFYVGFSPLY